MPNQQPARYGGIGDDAVRKATGAGWDEWLTRIDAAGGAELTHKQIAAWLHETGVPDWWSQMVTVGYEQARGRRVAHQKPDGYSVSASKTIGVPPARAFSAWKLKRTRDRWLPGAPLEIRKATENRSLRLTWTEDDTRIDVNFYAKGDDRCQVAVQHERLGSAKLAEQRKKFWRERMEALKSLLEA